MSECRFLYENLASSPEALAVSSARPGAVGTPAPEALGSAVCYAGGSHTGAQDQVFVVEIDGEGAGGAVGSATFRWQRVSADTWEASGVPTATAFTALADGVAVKWAHGAGQELYKGDRWSLLAVGRRGEQPLSDRDRDTRWRSTGCAAEWVRVDLATPTRVRALVLADHNLGGAATAVLKGNDSDAWDAPAYSQAISLTRPHLVHFLDATHRFWRLELSDPANPEGSLAASLLYLGDYFAPARTFAAEFTQGAVAGRRLTTSDAGKVAGSATALATFFQLSFPRLSPEDAEALEAMMAVIHDHASGGLKPILFTPFSDDPGSTLYCLPAAQLERRRLPGGRWDLGLRLEEVVRTDV
ncbi:MAG: hypothetical protein K9K66_14155 [Desulfarculaceae bacterium]|nr:hypothetical protein [Desulfarculaceae bacterium]MCF8073815.1 hypothetical protein [Desulfarculaceae bacterium]MCF8102795.1 hypothetical protein [Desulfarculaceae bacterium]MCF8116239.1 hypothetical protein [Desulfarculaceae bacterium]